MSDVHKTIEAVWRIESTRLIAAIARVTGDIGIAEELAQDALVTALELWPEEGVPENPGAWLMQAAKRRAIDSLRRGHMLAQKHEELARDLEWQQQRLADALEHSMDQVIDDDILRLIFTACHPILPVEARIALTLRLLGGPGGVGTAGGLPDLQRGIHRDVGRGMDARCTLRGCVATRTHAGATSPRRIGSPCTAGTDGVAGIADCGAARKKRRGGVIAGPGPLSMELRADSAGHNRTRARTKTGRRRETLCIAGGDRCLSQSVRLPSSP